MSGSVTTAVGVARFAEDVSSLSTLDRIEYADLYTLPTEFAGHANAERWARAVLEDGTIGRTQARRLWRALGLRLGPKAAPAYVQGWRIAGRGPDWIRAETASWYMSGEAVVRVGGSNVRLALFLRFDRPAVAAPIWAVIGPCTAAACRSCCTRPSR